MACACNTILISSAVIEDGNVILIPNRTIRTLTNAETYRFVIAVNVQSSENAPVFIRVGNIDIPVLCKYGNTMYANQLRTRYNYAIGYGNANTNYENGQFVIFNGVCPRSYPIGVVESV